MSQFPKLSQVPPDVVNKRLHSSFEEKKKKKANSFYLRTTTAATAPATSNHKSTLSGGAIAGIAIGGFAVLVLAAALIYMCGRQKTIKEVLRQSQLPPLHPTSYQAASPGLSEAHYSNMHKSPNMSSNGRFSPYGIPPTETESYRSMSPPIDERMGMMRVQPMTMRNGQPSPGSPPYDRTGFVGTHEMDNETERCVFPSSAARPLLSLSLRFMLPPKISSSHLTIYIYFLFFYSFFLSF